MSWIDRIENIELEIITGDKKKYYPLWKDAKKNYSFNVESFNFIGVKGTYVERQEIQSARYDLTLYFQGENHVEVANAFLKSSENKNAWTINHPIYDNIIVQPSSISIDNTSLNYTLISCLVQETILKDFPHDSLDYRTLISQMKVQVSMKLIKIFDNKNINTSNISLQTVGNINTSNVTITKKYEFLSDLRADIKVLKNLLRQATSGLKSILDDAGYFMEQVINLINYPFVVEQDIEFKINKIRENYDTIKNMFIHNKSNDIDYELFQAYSVNMFTEVCLNVVNPRTKDYESRTDVDNVIELIISMYNNLILTFDGIDFDPNDELMLNINNIVSMTVAELYLIAFNSKQERKKMLDRDDNIINLAFKYFGQGDENLEKFIKRNKISLDEHLQVNKGRKIIYYVS